MAPTIIPTKQLPVTTTVATPGVNTNIPTEKAVRDAITANQSSASAKLFLYNNCQ